MTKKEIYWLIGSTIFVLILNALIFGIDGFKTDSYFDLNIYDTYYIIPNIYFILLLGVLIFFGIYLVRTLHRSFKNLTANLISIVSTILLILVLNRINSMLEVLIQQEASWTTHPPLSAGESQPEIASEKNYLEILSTTIFYIQIFLLTFLAYCGFKTGRNYKSNE